MADRYRIAIIAGQLVVGGAERQLFLWLSNINRDRFDPVLLTLHPGNGDYWEKPIENLGIPLIRIPRRGIRLARLREIVSALRPHHPMLIHGWHLFTSPYAAMAAKILGAKDLGGLRGDFGYSDKHSMEAVLSLRFNGAILTNSLFAAEQIRVAQKRKTQSIYTVQNAVEDHPFMDRQVKRDFFENKYGISKTCTWLVSVGRLDPGKKVDLQLQVASLLKKFGEDFHLFIIGDGPARSALEKLTNELNLNDKVTFTGEIPNGSNWLSAFDIYCFTSLHEGLPNAVMEAAAASLPIIAWDLPYMRELMGECKGAILVEPENLGEFSGRLSYLIGSPVARAKLGQLARSHTLDVFSLQRFLKGMTSVYEDVMGIPSMGGKS